MIELVGREAETSRLDALLDRLPQRGGALIVRGEPGIGKSALLKRAAATDARTLTVVGTESEAELGFAGLYELLRPIAAGMTSLPAAQRRALEAAFGLAEEPVPELFRVALAALQVISDSAPLVL